jgi:hypothetical protein
LESSLDIELTAGQSYIIAVGAYSDAQFSGTFTITFLGRRVVPKKSAGKTGKGPQTCPAPCHTPKDKKRSL